MTHLNSKQLVLASIRTLKLLLCRVCMHVHLSAEEEGKDYT